LTAEGFRPYPRVREIINHIDGKSVIFPEINREVNVIYPTLVTAQWCPYTMPAIRVWEEAASFVGLHLRVFYAGTIEGDEIIATANVAGVPCLIANPKTLYYGLDINSFEARSFLKKRLKNHNKKIS
jgi:hypothetical protein